jgi:multisubunit Na+/H+ antiporter MnhE subunit
MMLARIRSAAMWWLALFGLWLLFVGTRERYELIGGACAAAVGAAFADALRGEGLLRFRFEELGWLASRGVPWKILRDFGVLVWALALHLTRARSVRSAYVAVPFAAGGSDASSAGRRALATVLGTISPNSVVLDIDPERNVALRHDLVPSRAGDSVP